MKELRKIDPMLSQTLTGPAHWITQLGPPRYTKILSYLIGWVTNALWLFTTSGTILVLVNTLFACIEATHSDYVRQVWHVYLTYVAVSGFALIINLPKGMHLVTFALTYVTIYVNATILFVLITLLVRVYPKQSAETVFITVVNETGWSSNALVFFLSLLPGLAAINGFDTASHMTEETQNPSRDIPLSMIGAAGISYVGAIPAILVYMYCVVDSDALVNAVGNQPMIQLIKDGFRSKPLFILASVLIIFIIGISSVVSLMSWSRLYCAFSKTNGLPGSSFTSRNISVEGVPLNALYVTTVLTIAIGAIQLGSETAMVSIIGGSCLCAALTYAILFALLLKKGRSSLPADRWLKLGPFGTPITILALAWESWAIFWMCFPMYYPVTAINMNYTSVVVVGILILCPLYYFVCRHNFQLS